ncbi:MAG: hypothetical protein EHM23_32090 [Acidobacteria bacterium]|nr:MAG: hypothetical protein EHM23_32090 [Acidobacteriota bacterium]
MECENLEDLSATAIEHARHPRNHGALERFNGHARITGPCGDTIIIDSPPGTGDEPLSVCQLIGNLDGAVIVTTPQKVAAVDVRKSITFCRRLGVPVLGVIENMNGFVCPRCGVMTQILRAGAGRRMAEDLAVPFLGSIPIDSTIADSCDDGRPFLQGHEDSPTAKLMHDMLIRVEEAVVGTAAAEHPLPGERSTVDFIAP